MDVVIEDRGRSYPSLGSYTSMHFVAIEPAASFPLRPLELRVEGSDVMGRPYSLRRGSALEVAAPTDTVSDLSLDTLPPEGAYAGSVGVVRGLFRIRNNAVVAFDEPPAGATALRVDLHGMQARCGGDGADFALASGDGAMNVRRLSCAEVFAGIRLEIPGSGPLYLVVHEEVEADQPQYGSSWDTGVDLPIAAFAFE